jgi:hypothetical protein
MMAKGGDYRNYRSQSPGPEKRSPTGRKISMDIKPRISPRDSLALGVGNKRPKMVESDEVSNKLSHIYVNLSDMEIKETTESDQKTSEISPTKSEEDNSSEVTSIPNELKDIKTTNM